MGWWRAGEDGSSLHAKETGLVWGDGPADIMDDAIDKIVAEFMESYSRKPTRTELQAGLLFSLGAYEETDGPPEDQQQRQAREIHGIYGRTLEDPDAGDGPPP
jgi:hypothetical protein